MNERIRELAEQAKCYADENNAHYLQNQHWIETFEEKFAELIVRECANVAAEHDALDIYEEIREHFGVEE